MNLETLINEKYDSLNATDREITKFFVQNKEFVCNASIAAVAEKSLFSKSSIFRTCQKLGLSGFSQLHFVLKDEESDEDSEDLNVDYLSETTRSLLWTINQFKRTNLDEVYGYIADAPHVYIYATGWEQQIVAQQLQRNLYLLGRMAFVFPSAVDEMTKQADTIAKDDVLIIISHSGMNTTVLKMAARSRLSGVKIISFTSFSENKLARMAHFNLYYDGIKKIIPTTTHKEIFFANLHVLVDIFCMALANYLGKTGENVRRGDLNDDDDEK